MSYLLYINGNLTELPSRAPIPQTKQVNDLARLDNRQSNFTNKFILPFTATNIKAMEGVYLVGNNSNLPYQKNECDLFDADSGACLIYKGWAVVSKTTNKGYEINVYDGLIDFYRAIENKSLSDVGISELNHAKSIATIIESWDNDLPYLYALADYNGNNEFTPPSGVAVQINSDYQVPSARVSFLWNKVFEFAGFTYSGLFFETEAFTNLFMTFPKPVPILSPYVEEQTQQYSEIIEEEFIYSVGEAGIFIGSVSFSKIFPNTFDSSHSNNLAGYVEIETYGAYRLTSTGSFTNNAGTSGVLNWQLRDSSSVLIASGSIDAEQNQSVIFTANPTNRLSVSSNVVGGNTPSGSNNLSGSVYTSLDYVIGYDANFEDALVDFSCKDFVNEIMQECGLTAFKNKYSKHIDFLTVNEILASGTRIDWSSKFQFKETESYKIGRYAKINNFKYRYNGDNESHNNGSFAIDDENLADNVDVLHSKLYTPEKRIGKIYGKEVPIFKIWEKEVKDDSTVEYKELTGRFYFLRAKQVNNLIRIASKELNTEETTNFAMFANYSGLKFRELIENNYTTIARILNKGKIVDAYFDLKPKDIETFSFKIPIYVEQLASNYIVNKIMNFVKGRTTKVELLEVDYNPALDIVPSPDTSYITIDSFDLDGCQVTVNYSTDAPVGTLINFTCTLNNFGIPSTVPINPIYEFFATVQNSGVTNSFTFTLQDGAYYVMYFQIPSLSIISNQAFFENNGTCSIDDTVTATRLEITDVEQGTLEGWIQFWSITFDSDVTLPTNVLVRTYNPPITDLNNPYFGLGGWSPWNDAGIVSAFTFDYITALTVFGGPISQFQMKIGNLESNIYIL
jgi:hypothetical protein